MHDWQRDVMACWLAEDDGERYVCDTCGLLVPRQNGKTEVIAARILFGVLFANDGKGELIAYSAHRVDTTLEMFDTIIKIFGDSRKPPEEWANPELHELVSNEVFVNGHQRIELKNGSVVTFNARSKGNRRGFTVDVQIYDEAGFLTDEQLSASKSTISAAPHRNPQTIYAGTPPSENGIYAEPFARVRDKAIAKIGNVSWHEWSIESLEPQYLSDRNVWAECNPSLGKNLLWQAVESELIDMSAEKFAIERLCWWPETAAAGVFDSARWDAAAVDIGDAEDVMDGFDKMAIGVKFAPDGLQVCVSVALLSHENGVENVHVELQSSENTLSGTRWLVDSLLDAKERIACIAIDGRSGAEYLGGALVRGGYPSKAINIMSAHDAVAATAMATNMLAEGRLTHNGNEVLAASAKAAIKRKIGTDGYGLGGDSCAIESACAAIWAVVTTKRNPKRKQLIG